MSLHAELLELPEPEAGTEVLDKDTRRTLLRRKPGRMLAALRRVSNEAIETTSRGTDLPVHVLQGFEAGAARPTADALMVLARHHNVDAHSLLDAFGYV